MSLENVRSWVRNEFKNDAEKSEIDEPWFNRIILKSSEQIRIDLKKKPQFQRVMIV